MQDGAYCSRILHMKILLHCCELNLTTFIRLDQRRDLALALSLYADTHATSIVAKSAA